MLDSVENRIADAFNNVNLSVTSEDILLKSVHKKKHIFNWLIGLSVPTFILSGCMILFFINNSNNELINQKIRQKEYINEVIGVANSLDVNLYSKNQYNLENNNVFIESVYNKIQKNLIFNLNMESLEYSFSEIEGDYSTQCVINDLFNNEYVFNYNLEGNCLNGEIAISNVLSCSVESSFRVQGKNVYAKSIYSLYFLNMNICSYNVIEDENYTQYTYLLGDDEYECFSYRLVRNENSISIFYEDSLSFEFSKCDDSKYIVYYKIYDLSGSFSVEYSSLEDFSINFQTNED